MRHSIAFNFYEMASRHSVTNIVYTFFFYSVGQLLMQQLGSLV
jgi:hypothetical protein